MQLLCLRRARVWVQFGARGFIVALAISALVSHSCGCFTCFNQLFMLR